MRSRHSLARVEHIHGLNDNLIGCNRLELHDHTMPPSEKKKKALVINGPNLNLLGTRERQTYGSTTLAEIESATNERAPSLGIEISHFQSNHEGSIVDRIHEARPDGVHGIVIHPGAFAHISVAIRDALLGVDILFVELHISSVHAREPFRRHSYLSDKAQAVIAGLGVYGYVTALSGGRGRSTMGRRRALATTPDLECFRDVARVRLDRETDSPPRCG